MTGTLWGKKPVTSGGWHTPVIQAIQEAEVGDSQVQNQLIGIEEMALPLKALIVLAEESGLVPCTYTKVHSHLYLQSNRIWSSLLASVGIKYTSSAHTCIQANIHTHKTKSLLKTTKKASWTPELDPVLKEEEEEEEKGGSRSTLKEYLALLFWFLFFKTRRLCVGLEPLLDLAL